MTYNLLPRLSTSITASAPQTQSKASLDSSVAPAPKREATRPPPPAPTMTVSTAISSRSSAGSTIVHVGQYTDYGPLAHPPAGKEAGPDGGIVTCRWHADGKMDVLGVTRCLNPAFMT